jgi:hypothetical protein
MKICFHVEVDGSAGIWALAANRFGVKEMAMIDWYKRSSESIINHTNVIIKRYTQVDDFFDSEPLEDGTTKQFGQRTVSRFVFPYLETFIRNRHFVMPLDTLTV